MKARPGGELEGAFPKLGPTTYHNRYGHGFRAVPAFELAILRAIFHSKGPKA
jgi:hypothetical protein